MLEAVHSFVKAATSTEQIMGSPLMENKAALLNVVQSAFLQADIPCTRMAADIFSLLLLVPSLLAASEVNFTCSIHSVIFGGT